MDAVVRRRIRRRMLDWARRSVDEQVEPVLVFCVSELERITEAEVIWIEPTVAGPEVCRILRLAADQLEREHGALVK